MYSVETVETVETVEAVEAHPHPTEGFWHLKQLLESHLYMGVISVFSSSDEAQRSTERRLSSDSPPSRKT